MDQKLRREPLGRGFFVNVTGHHGFGTDAVILSHFAAPKNNDTLVDLGTGCGIIPLLMLRDGFLKSAVGVDISQEAAELLKITVSQLELSKLTVIHSDLNDLKGKIPFGCHTLVTCNPPYKAPGAGITNTDSVNRVARHEVACTLEDVVRTAAGLLQSGGRFCICQRPERLAELMELMSKYKTEPKRLRLVAQRRGREPWLILLEGRRGGNRGLRIEPTLYVEDENGGFSPEMTALYGPYKEAYL